MIEELDSWNELRWKWYEKWDKMKYKIMKVKVVWKLITKHMTIINDNDYINP